MQDGGDLVNLLGQAVLVLFHSPFTLTSCFPKLSDTPHSQNSLESYPFFNSE
ncbi:hypothetical protein HMPREF1549_00044 [Actinomyces johnsonii F0510]|uniref:Uncharacterized protein n=1 Tax=Actinomyces johnsonii F0510 TaxID=1227262 RepID=U1RVQ6_9ACTO|nr:hypothetical protein HMPREF1549_00044 [Actinomyces johnsonii F0510]